jgi:hypothetical protein
VYSEYQTYLRNKNNTEISYAYVDSVNIFKFIETILVLPRNNPIHTFEKFNDIEIWLREQWAGLFRELLQRMSDQKKFSELSQQVDDLKEINNTLKTYLESVMRAVSVDNSSELIELEEFRINKIFQLDEARNNSLFQHLIEVHNINEKDLYNIIIDSKTINDFSNKVKYESTLDSKLDIGYENIGSMLERKVVIEELNTLRKIFNLPEFNKKT